MIDGPPNEQWLRDYGVSVPSDICGWSGTIVLDDVQPLLTVLGGGACVVALLAAIVVLLSIRIRGRWWLRLAIGLVGAAAWVATWSAVDQFGPGAETSKWLWVANLYLTPVVVLISAFLVGRGVRKDRGGDLDAGDPERAGPAR